MGHTNAVIAVDYYPDVRNLKLVSGCRDGTLRVWDAAKYKELCAIKGSHPGPAE